MKKKGNTTNPKANKTSKDALQLNPSILKSLLRFYKVPPQFSSQQLEDWINQFDAFVKNPKVAALDRQEKIKVFRAEKAWTGDEGKDFNISGAIFKGWLITKGDKDVLKDLMFKKKGKQGDFDWVYRYECRKCGSIDQRRIPQRLHEYQYNRLPEDEAVAALLGNKEIKICPNCGGYVQFKRVRARTESWAREQQKRKVQRRRTKDHHKILLTGDQMTQHFKAIDKFCNTIRARYMKIFSDTFNPTWSMMGIEETKRKLDQLWIDAKPYVKATYEPLGINLCARYNCLRPLPLGSRGNRKYCSEECKSIEKSRRARRK